MSTDRLYIIIPVYNEEDTIEKVAREWHRVVERVGNNSRVAVFNDGSKDSTLSILNSLKSQLPFLEVVDKPNSGHGQTCVYGYKYAIGRGADYVFQTDSDDQTYPEDFWQFWDKRNEHNFIFGFRPKRGDGAIRFVISRVLAAVILALLGEYVKDSNVPFRLHKAEALKKYLDLVPQNFYLANSLLPVLITRDGQKIKWLDIKFAPRKHGQDSVPLKKMFKVGIRVIKDFAKLKRAL